MDGVVLLQYARDMFVRGLAWTVLQKEPLKAKGWKLANERNWNAITASGTET
jgi:hypothetical protein